MFIVWLWTQIYFHLTTSPELHLVLRYWINIHPDQVNIFSVFCLSCLSLNAAKGTRDLWYNHRVSSDSSSLSKLNFGVGCSCCWEIVHTHTEEVTRLCFNLNPWEWKTKRVPQHQRGEAVTAVLFLQRKKKQKVKSLGSEEEININYFTLGCILCYEPTGCGCN